MARQPSKIMSVVEKKVAIGSLNLALKNHGASVKEIDGTLKEAEKAMILVLKTSDAATKQFNKDHAALAKANDATIKAARKTLDAAVAKHTKLAAAAVKGNAKLETQLEALKAAPTGNLVAPAPAGVAKKAKAQAKEAETV